jgi:hypothetical protein
MAGSIAPDLAAARPFSSPRKILNKKQITESNNQVWFNPSHDLSTIFLEDNIMDIHLPEMFGWHPKEGKPEETTEPTRFTKWSVMTALILLVLVTIGYTAFYFSEYIAEVFRNLY